MRAVFIIYFIFNYANYSLATEGQWYSLRDVDKIETMRCSKCLDKNISTKQKIGCSDCQKTFAKHVDLDHADFILIRAGQFNMGSHGQTYRNPFVIGKKRIKTKAEVGRYYNEKRVMGVEITQDFLIAETPVTQFQHWSATKTNPSFFKKRKHCPTEHLIIDKVPMCPTHPVESISWSEAQQFIGKLNKKESPKYAYRLPTEAEWEYAARGGIGARFFFGRDAVDLGNHAWYRDNSEVKERMQTHPVAELLPNSLRLYDTLGNVWEWVADSYVFNRSSLPIKDPRAQNNSQEHVIRGGGFRNKSRDLRFARRDYMESKHCRDSIGFRLVRKEIQEER